MASFIGTFTNKIDKKGRISVPARFRAALAAQTPGEAGANGHTNGGNSGGGSAGGVVVVSPNAALGAIEACDYQRIEDTISRLDERDGLTPEERQDVEFVLSRSEELSVDREGRIILPDALISLAGIGDKATFVGIGRTFQVWSPERREAWQAQTAKAPEQQVGLKDLWSLGARTPS